MVGGGFNRLYMGRQLSQAGCIALRTELIWKDWLKKRLLLEDGATRDGRHPAASLLSKDKKDRRRRLARGAGVLTNCWRSASDRTTTWSPMMPPFGKTSLILVKLTCLVRAQATFWPTPGAAWNLDVALSYPLS